jgi:hypothetical protein
MCCLVDRRDDRVVMVVRGRVVMLAERKVVRPAADFLALLVRRRRCPGLMVAVSYVAKCYR